MRIHRIGQTKKVAIKRFIVKVYLVSQFCEILHTWNMILSSYTLNWALLIASLGMRNLVVN